MLSGAVGHFTLMLQIGRSRNYIVLAVLVLWIVLRLVIPVYAQGRADYVVVGKINGVIDNSVADYVSQLISYAESIGAKIVVLELNTPGGSLEAALRIITTLRESLVPVVGYVVNRWAVSAGTMILMCTHYAAMQPGTIIGAVQPVMISPLGGYVPINESKILNPVYKEIEVCMKMHHRNTTVAKEFVYHNLVLDAEEAKKYHVIEAVAANLGDLLAKVNGSIVYSFGKKQVIILHNVRLVYYEMSVGLKLAHWLSDPFIGSLLTSLGFIILLLALATHHLAFASLALALIILGFFSYGFSTSILAVVILLTGLIMLLIELFVIPGFGVVGITGIILLILGAFMMFTSKPVYIASGTMRAAFYTLLAIMLPLSGLASIVIYKAVHAWRMKPVYTPSVVGKRGKAIDDIPVGGTGFVMVEGEYWQATNRGDKPIKRGDHVIVIGKDGSILIVKKVEPSS